MTCGKCVHFERPDWPADFCKSSGWCRFGGEQFLRDKTDSCRRGKSADVKQGAIS